MPKFTTLELSLLVFVSEEIWRRETVEAFPIGPESLRSLSLEQAKGEGAARCAYVPLVCSFQLV